ncbi:hypothetical protein SADUNF_Sadunf07G0119900 [Salix dunnii]|uniref:Bulb-type lectin domain-containing protein n=1 Tax=Salix dunnii TaxID=1413687 RepID=A0A835K6C7_9ROSI|nr:hypothetical protein SADUNF_Sadunf07G0119900 [Salix dunnii]
MIIFSSVVHFKNYILIHLTGNQTLTSPDGDLKTVKSTVVWVANREHPVPNPSLSGLRLLEDGNLYGQLIR